MHRSSTGTGRREEVSGWFSWLPRHKSHSSQPSSCQTPLELSSPTKMELLQPSHPPGPPGDPFSGYSPPASFLHGFDQASPPAASSLPEIVHQSGVIGDRVHVAVGKSVEKSESLLHWTFRQFGNYEICLVHVHQPSLLIPTLLGKLPASQANGEVVTAHRREEKKQTTKLLLHYSKICSRMKVKSTIITTEADQVQKGIVDLVNTHVIRKLVMGGTVPDNCMKVKMNSSKANYAAKNVPEFCEIWFIHKGKHVWTKEAFEAPDYLPSVSPPKTQTGEDLGFQTEYIPLSASPSSVFSVGDRNGVEGESLRTRVPSSPALSDSTSRNDPQCSPASLSTFSGYNSSADKRVSTDSISKMEEESLYCQLAEATIEAEVSRNEAFLEFLKCQKLELEALNAIGQVKAFESAYAHEVELRKHAELALRSTRQEQDNFLEEKEKQTREIQKTMRNIALLNTRSQEAIRRRDEATEELKLVQASIAMLQHEKQKIQRQKMEVMHWLDRWRSRGQAGTSHCNGFIGILEELPELAEFSLSDLESATCNFSESFKIGEGGNGSVYKGEMLDKTVAIKKLHPHNMQGQSEFQREVQVLGRIQHPHLVTLIGSSPEAGSLVYEYLPKGSLQDRLFRKRNNPPLTWKVRARIITEISSALLFLHSCKPGKIVHGNLRPENILLDSDLRCKICDFGICRLVSDDALRCPSFRRGAEPKGAFPYQDPELSRTGILTPKSDVYSFGVIILQLLTGRPPVGLASEVRKAVACDKLASVLDFSAGEWPTHVSGRLVELALKCCESNSRDRPELKPTLVRELEQLHVSEEQPVPSFFLCPILQEIMHDPHVAADGFTYEKEAMLGWLENGRETSPMTNLRLSHLHLIPNHSLRMAIQDWLCKS